MRFVFLHGGLNEFTESYIYPTILFDNARINVTLNSVTIKKNAANRVISSTPDRDPCYIGIALFVIISRCSNNKDSPNIYTSWRDCTAESTISMRIRSAVKSICSPNYAIRHIQWTGLKIPRRFHPSRYLETRRCRPRTHALESNTKIIQLRPTCSQAVSHFPSVAGTRKTRDRRVRVHIISQAGLIGYGVARHPLDPFTRRSSIPNSI